MSFSVNVNITYESHNSIFIRQDLNLRQNNKGRSRNDMFYDNKFSFDRGESLLMLNPELLWRDREYQSKDSNLQQRTFYL